MKRCIVYYSKTGHTKFVVDKFDGFDVFRVTAENDNPSILNPILTNMPDITTYEHIIFASPVHGLQLAKVMKEYLEQLKDLNHKVIDTFVTHYFRFAILGGTQTLKQMKRIIRARGGHVRYETSINRKSKKSYDVMINLIKKYSK